MEQDAVLIHIDGEHLHIFLSFLLGQEKSTGVASVDQGHDLERVLRRLDQEEVLVQSEVAHRAVGVDGHLLELGQLSGGRAILED